MLDSAVFLDRDNTLIEDPGFIDHPDQVKLLPGAVEALHRFCGCGYRIIIVSNQSGIARGHFDEQQLSRVHQRLGELLKAEEITIDAIYYCPYLDGEEAVVEKYRKDSELRKPAPGMLLRAARERGIDLSRSWMIGDRISDIQAGTAACCRTILVRSNRTQYNNHVQPDHQVQSILEAARVVEQHRNSTDKPSLDSPEPTTHELLAEIRDTLQRQQRQELQDDFSLVRLLGSLMQMLAIVAGLWGIVAIFGGRDVAAIPRIGLAIFFQLLAVTIHFTARKR
ncbi:MAG: HAD family hydrolase [Phycisphaerae bacterium]|nr:HAD family hydrolase [Phycisphaerae bacterium]